MADSDLLGKVDEYHGELWRSSQATTFLRERGLRHSTIERFRLGYVPRGYYRGRLAIPYQSGLYSIRAIRYRELPGSGSQGVKYLGEKGSKVHVFAPTAANERVGVICEGEMDAMSVWTIGSKAVAIPGANVWQDHWALLFRNCEYVMLAFDPDVAGERAGRKVERSLSRYGIEARFADLPVGMDVNDVLISKGAKAVHEMLHL